jgi:DNA-binding NtrC family response regulator
MTRQAMEVLCAYDWPGNVRELENAVERARTLCEGGIIQAADLPPTLLANVKMPTQSLDANAAMTLPVVPDSALYPLHPGLEPGAAPEGGQARAEEVLPLKTYLLQQEQVHLNRAIQQCGGNKDQAALLLGISIATLYRRMAGEDKEP